MTQEELNEILKKHEMWLNREEGGEKAGLSGADLTGATLVGANLTRANLSGAVLWKADLSGANLRRAKLSQSNLALATYDSQTVFPEGFNPEKHSMRKVGS